jgi:glycosyltransferase involved in cell wall biosynthesis
MIHIVTAHWRSDRWIDIQLKYLYQNITRPFKIYAFLTGLSGEHRGKYYYSSIEPIESHSIKLNLLADMAYLHADGEDDWLMFIDGDAFPIGDVISFGSEKLGSWPLLAIQRWENCGDIQPHPSFCLTTIGFWQAIGGDWKQGHQWRNARGELVTDVGGNLLKALQDRDVDWYPMLRSNKRDLHPLWFGIYEDLIYHHGAGFRFPISRFDIHKDSESVDECLKVTRAVAESTVLSQRVYELIQRDASFYRYFQHLHLTIEGIDTPRVSKGPGEEKSAIRSSPRPWHSDTPEASTQPLVSVCIPSYNASKYIGETIRSVLDSTYSNLEIIVSDDASTDNTREIVAGFDDGRVRFFQNETNLGAPKNWNRALEKASGEFIGLLNHDDLYGPFWLTFAVYVLRRYSHIGWVVSAGRIVDEKGQTLSIDSRFPATREYSRNEAFLCTAKLGGMGPGVIVRREILEEVGYYDAEAGPYADHDLCLRLASRYPLYYSNNPHHAAWRYHADNLTHRCMYGEVGMRAIDCLKRLNKVFRDDAFPEELRKCEKECYTYFYDLIITRCMELLKSGEIETVQRLVRLLSANGNKN